MKTKFVTNFLKNSPSQYLSQSWKQTHVILRAMGVFFKFLQLYSLPLKILVKTLAKTFLIDLLLNLLKISEETDSKKPLVFLSTIVGKTVSQ